MIQIVDASKIVARSVIPYLIAILVLFVISSVITPVNLYQGIVQGGSLLLSLSLIIAMIGSVLSHSGKKMAGITVSIIAFWSAFLFSFDFITLGSYFNSFQRQFILPLFLIEESIVFFFYSRRVLTEGILFNGGFTITGLSRTLLIFSLGYASYFYGLTRPFSLFFIPPGIVSFVLSFTAVLVSSSGEVASTLGKYLARSAERYGILSVVAGIFLILYEYPKAASINSYILLFLFLIVIFAIVRVAWKTYSSAASRILKISNDIYNKHRHNDVLLPDASLDSVMGSVSEFVKNGEKEKLLITLTMILTNGGFTVEECNKIMRSLIVYKVPDPLIFNVFAVRSRVEREIRHRDQIVKELVTAIKNGGNAAQ